VRTDNDQRICTDQFFPMAEVAVCLNPRLR